MKPELFVWNIPVPKVQCTGSWDGFLKTLDRSEYKPITADREIAEFRLVSRRLVPDGKPNTIDQIGFREHTACRKRFDGISQSFKKEVERLFDAKIFRPFWETLGRVDRQPAPIGR